MPNGVSKTAFFLGISVFFIAANLLFLDYLQVRANQNLKQDSAPTVDNSCDRTCVFKLINQAVADLKNGITPTPLPSGTLTPTPVGETCDKACVKAMIDQTVPTLVNSIVASQPTPTTTIRTTTTSTKTTQSKTIDLPGGTAAGTDWTKIGNSEFWFDASLYGTLTKATWQGWLEVQDMNGSGFVRLYDGTNKRAVDGSQMEIGSGAKSSFYSGNLSIWRGQNQYWLEVKSTTGYPVTVSGAQMKVTYY